MRWVRGACAHREEVGAVDRLRVARVLLLAVVIEGRDAEQAVVLFRVGVRVGVRVRDRVRVRVRVRVRDRVRVRVRFRGNMGEM